MGEKRKKAKLDIDGLEVLRFESGDTVSFPTKEFSGYYTVEADDGGYQISASGVCLVVTDNLLSDAPRIGGERAEDIRNRKVKPSYARRVSLGEASWLSSRSLRLYHCGCADKSYDNESYNRWLEDLKSGMSGGDGKGTYWKDVAGDVKPIDWPDLWINGLCNECGEVISCGNFDYKSELEDEQK